MRAVISRHLIDRAAEALRSNVVLKQTDRYQIFELPARANEAEETRVLFLWNEGHNFSIIPPGLLLPVSIDGRYGYFWNRDQAMSYNA